MRRLERERDAIVMENEEAITGYYKIRQQLDRLGKQMQVHHVHPTHLYLTQHMHVHTYGNRS